MIRLCRISAWKTSAEVPVHAEGGFFSGKHEEKIRLLHESCGKNRTGITTFTYNIFGGILIVHLSRQPDGVGDCGDLQKKPDEASYLPGKLDGATEINS